jgi:hypothetical protein
MNKAIIFDASTLISFAMNGLLPELKSLKEIFEGKFIITDQVKKEVIDRPITTKRFELEALKIKELLEEKVFEMPESLGIKNEEVLQRTQELTDIANNTFEANGEMIHLVDFGESSCLALSKMLTKKGIKNVIAVDERTIRMLGEKPENLKNLFQKKLKTKIKTNLQNYVHFKEFKFIRSSELVYIIYKKGLVKLKGPMVLDALLYALKFKGCSISYDEIREIEKLS